MPENPYANPYDGSPAASSQIRQVSIRPLDLFQRGFQRIKDQYWLFLGMSLVAVLIGSAVPMGILLGPMMVGLHLALAQKTDFGRTEFGILFKGFDKFGDALIATLIMLGVSLVILVPLGILAFVAMAVLAAGAASTNEAAVGFGVILVFGGYLSVIIFVSLLCYLPFLFTFQLIADQNLTGLEACKVSWKGVTTNLFGLILYVIVLGITNLILTLMCFFPVYLFMPISFASMFELYRDVYGLPAPRKPL